MTFGMMFGARPPVTEEWSTDDDDDCDADFDDDDDDDEDEDYLIEDGGGVGNEHLLAPGGPLPLPALPAHDAHSHPSSSSSSTDGFNNLTTRIDNVSWINRNNDISKTSGNNILSFWRVYIHTYNILHILIFYLHIYMHTYIYCTSQHILVSVGWQGSDESARQSAADEVHGAQYRGIVSVQPTHLLRYLHLHTNGVCM